MTDGLVVRACRDLDDIGAIEATMPTGRSEFHRGRFEHGDGSTYLLAWLDGRPVGHALCLRESKYPEVTAMLGRVPEVSGLGVLDEARRRGVGRALMTAAHDRARAAGAGMAGLAAGLSIAGKAVDADDEPAIGLYLALGYRLHPTLRPVDEWAWTDDDGVVHPVADPCEYWTIDL